VSSTPRSIDAGVSLGEIFIGKYRIDSILGHGGMGVVALCTHLELNERVAIKMLRRDVLDDPDAVARFMREAQAAVKLKSEFVARVTDVGRSDTDVPYMVMEYLEGHDLGELLDERGSIGQPWAVELTLQACEALAEAHSIGIVHRDVKPTNLFVTWRPDGSSLIKVLDFGISKSPIVNAMQLTQTQSLLGTPAYMSPEQMRSARMVDSRTDIWSLGTVLYELLEGRRPFEAESFSEMCVKVAVDPPGTMTNTPTDLQEVVLRCLAKAPEHRYASMAELARDLVPFSHDPHQAQVLVERMSRMLRRSQAIDWDPARTSMPMQVREVRSLERPAEAEPAEPVVSAPSPSAPRVSRRAEVEPVPSKTLAVPPRRKRRGAIVIAVLLAAGLGVAISLLRTPAPSRAEVTSPTRPTPLVDDHPITTGSGSAPGSAIEAIAPSRGSGGPTHATAPDVNAGKSATGPGKLAKPARPGNLGAPQPNKGATAPKGEHPKPACDPFATAHGSDACPSDN
jgi:eukaryotic-like serine/threonine-protein kinase